MTSGDMGGEGSRDLFLTSGNAFGVFGAMLGLVVPRGF